MQKIAEGRKGGMEEFYGLYGKLIYYAAYSVCRTKADADDVVNKVLIKIWNLSSALPETENPEGWLYSVSVNAAKDLLRERRYLPLHEDYPDARDGAEDIDGEDAFYSMIGFLSEAERRIIVCRIIRKMPFGEIAEEEGMPLGSVTAMYYRSLKKVRKQLEGRMESGD